VQVIDKLGHGVLGLKEHLLVQVQIFYLVLMFIHDNFRSYFQDTDAFSFRFYNGTEYIIATNRLFRDTSAWYHMVIVADTTKLLQEIDLNYM
jgi:hypothetical protein